MKTLLKQYNSDPENSTFASTHVQTKSKIPLYSYKLLRPHFWSTVPTENRFLIKNGYNQILL